MNQEYLKKLKDPKFYLENFCKIKGKGTSRLIPFVLNEAQKDLFNTLNKFNRIISLKARQLGLSTGIVGYLYHKTITTPATNTAIIGYNNSLTAELLDKIKIFHRYTPEEIRPTIKYNSRSEISFPAIDSKIIVLPSTENVGRGYTLDFVLATEVAMWEKAEDKMTTLEASVPINGKLIVESSPRGINYFHSMWFAENDYVKKEYGWQWGYTKEQIEIIRRRMNNPMKFAQEYELKFLSSGRSIFDSAVIEEQRKNVLKIGDEVEMVDGIKYIVEEKNRLRIYRPPEKGHMYIAGSDVSEGLDGGDYSTAIIWDRRTGEEVAMFRGHIAPDLFGKKLDEWGRMYNNALMAVEINNHGLTTISILRQLAYPTLFFRPEKIDSLMSRTGDRVGWRTTKVTRPLLIDDFAQACRDKVLIIHSKELLDEMAVMQYDKNGDPTTESGFHDDLVFGAGIGFQGFKIMYDKPLLQIDFKKHLPVNFSY